MTGLEASVVARREAEDIAAIYAISVAEILSASSPRARTARRELAVRLVRLMPLKTAQRMLCVSKSYVEKVAQVAGVNRWTPAKLVWCARHGDELLVCTSYKAARLAVLDLRKLGIRGADVVRREVGVS